MKQAKWGVMTHYLADWIPRQNDQEITAAKWNDLIDRFDVEALAEQIATAGAGYHLISLGQNSGYYLSPNTTYDRIVGIRPSKCSKRDLIADLYEAHHRRGVKLMVYLPSGAPDKDPIAVQALSWQRGPHRNSEFQIKWQEVIREWSERWGKKVSGWWFDGAYWPNTMYRTSAPNFITFAAAARAGNPESVLAFNPGVFQPVHSITPFEDYTAGEIDSPENVSFLNPHNGISDGAQMHVLSHLGAEWGMGKPRYSAGQVIGCTRKVVEQGGVFTWDTPVQQDGHIAQLFIEQWSAIGNSMKPA
jgi:Alpha-L-fucosidase